MAAAPEDIAVYKTGEWVAKRIFENVETMDDLPPLLRDYYERFVTAWDQGAYPSDGVDRWCRRGKYERLDERSKFDPARHKKGYTPQMRELWREQFAKRIAERRYLIKVEQEALLQELKQIEKLEQEMQAWQQASGKDGKAPGSAHT